VSIQTGRSVYHGRPLSRVLSLTARMLVALMVASIFQFPQLYSSPSETELSETNTMALQSVEIELVAHRDKDHHRKKYRGDKFHKRIAGGGQPYGKVAKGGQPY
jgi:hypothetical protein